MANNEVKKAKVTGRKPIRVPAGKKPRKRIIYDGRCGIIIDRDLLRQIYELQKPDFVNGMYIDKNLIAAADLTLLQKEVGLSLEKVDSGVLAIQADKGAIAKTEFLAGQKVAEIKQLATAAIKENATIRVTAEKRPGRVMTSEKVATLKTATKRVAAKKKK